MPGIELKSYPRSTVNIWEVTMIDRQKIVTGNCFKHFITPKFNEQRF